MNDTFFVKDKIYLGLFMVLFWGSLLFTPFFAYSPAVLGLVGALLYPRDVRDTARTLRPVFIFAGVICAMAAVSLFWSAWPDDIAKRVVKLTAIIFFSLLLVCVLRAKARWFARRGVMLLLIGGWCAVAGLVALDQMLDFPFYRLMRGMSADEYVPGHVTNRHAAVLLIIGWVLAYGHMLSARGRGLGLYGPLAVMAVLMAVILCYSWSQAAQLGAVLAVLFLALFPYRRGWAWGAMIALLVAAIFAAPFIAVELYARVAAMIASAHGNTIFAQASGPQRLEIWGFIGQHILQSPLYGYGMEATRHIAFDAPRLFWDSNSVLHPHNFALQLWIEYGVFGAFYGAALCACLLATIRKYVHTREDGLIMAAFLSWFSVAAFGYGLWQSQFLGLGLFTFALMGALMGGALLTPRTETTAQ